jgi:DNA-binding NarL/FixJ family response regulator
MSDPIRVLIADDQELVRRGLAMVIEAQSDMTVVAEAANGHDAVERCHELPVDLALLDVRMPALDGLEAARMIIREHPKTRVVMLTTFDLDSYLYEALKIGVSGFFLKADPPEQLVAGIRAVVTGAALLAPSLTKRVVETYVRGPAPGSLPPELDPLSEREREVLGLVARGNTNSEIAATLIVGESTIKTHVSSIFSKLGLRDRTQAVVVAYETGLVRPGDMTGPPPRDHTTSNRRQSDD